MYVVMSERGLQPICLQDHMTPHMECSECKTGGHEHTGYLTVPTTREICWHVIAIVVVRQCPSSNRVAAAIPSITILFFLRGGRAEGLTDILSTGQCLDVGERVC